MKNALFITIGTRDVSIEESKLQEVLSPEDAAKAFQKNKAGMNQLMPRLGGLLIKTNLQKLKNHLKYPIINPFLEYLKNSDAPTFERIYLVATNQNKEIAKDFYDFDTIHFAEILKEILPEKYKFGNQSKIEIIEVKDNVVFIDSMFKFFSDRFKLKLNPVLLEFDEIHILNQGGIDAINYGLLINALYLYTDKIRLYNINEKNNQCTPLQFSFQFGLEQEKGRIKLAMERYDYSYIKSTSIGGDLNHWAAYAEARLNFDFDKADKHLVKLSLDNRKEQEFEREDINSIKKNTLLLTNELYWNAWIKYKQESYVDFIQRFFRIVEQYAQQKALSYMDGFEYNPNKEHPKWHLKITEYLEKNENQGLKNFLEGCVLDAGQKLELKYANIPVFMHILKYYNQEEFDFINRIEPLSKIRNKGIGAHGFDPISLAIILEKLSMDKDTFESTLDELGKKLEVSKNPFERINKNIEKFVS
jgi:hypothetical protein